MDRRSQELVVQPMPGAVAPVQADSDDTMLALWLDGRPASTRRAYEADARAFLALADKPLRAITLGSSQHTTASELAYLRLRRIAQTLRLSVA